MKTNTNSKTNFSFTNQTESFKGMCGQGNQFAKKSISDMAHAGCCAGEALNNFESVETNTVAELESLIRYHQRLYYDLNDPEISDYDFDKLWDRLQELSPNSPVLSERSQYDADYKHIFPMGSLSKCKSVEDVVAKLRGKSKDNKGLITAKLDGSSLSLHYDRGMLVRAVTRGRTETGKGKVVTANAFEISGVPKWIGNFRMDKFEVRGECVILLDDWVTIADKFKNPRNAASGGISCQDPRDTKSRKITFVACKMIQRKLGLNSPISTKDDQENLVDVQSLDQLEEMGFLVPRHVEVDLSNVESVRTSIEEWLKDRSSLPYWNDGIVIRIADDEVYNSLGFTGVCPNGAVAYKFENETAKTILRNIVWETGRLGYVTPVGIFDPVNLGGAKVEKCTLHNLDWMSKHGSPTIGAEIVVEKCGDIIPGLASVEKNGNGETNCPSTCPSCNSPLSFDGVKIRCSNKFECPAQFRDTVLNALRKFEIKGMADTTLDHIIDAGLVKKPWEILDLTQDALVSNGFGKRESELIVESIRDVEGKASHILAAVGIDMWGRRMFDLLQENDPRFTDERLLAGDFPKEELMMVKGVGPSKAEILSLAFAEGGYGREFLSELLKRVKVSKKDEEANIIGGKLTGKTFLITGTLSKSRKLVENDIQAAGGIISSGVSKNLNYLVVGADPGSKVDKARKANVTIIDEEILKAMMA